jgi:hypothetical protein
MDLAKPNAAVLEHRLDPIWWQRERVGERGDAAVGNHVPRIVASSIDA